MPMLQLHRIRGQARKERNKLREVALNKEDGGFEINPTQ